MIKKLFIITFLITITFSLSACISVKTGGALDGGIYKSADKGENWAQAVMIPTITEEKKSIANVDVNLMTFDPQDHKAIYIGTLINGMYYSYNGGIDWFHADALGNAKINSIAVDPKRKCTIFVAISNAIFKSIDCNRTFERIYYDTRGTTQITSIAIDSYDNKVIWAGTSAGDILKSETYGDAWTPTTMIDKNGKSYRISGSVLEILIDGFDTRIVYIAAGSAGFYKTADKGKTWVDLKDNLKKVSGDFKHFYDLEADKSKQDTLIYACKYGLLKTTDGGETWIPLNLVTPPSSTEINSVAVNPKNGNEIYYSTNQTFNKSSDGGVSWITEKLPTARAGLRLLIDPEEPSVLYMGTKKLEDKQSGLFPL